MSRAYVCPHCNRKSRIDPSMINDGVVSCPACRAPFALPDADEGRRAHAETAVIDTRSRAPAPEPAPSPSRARLPTVIMGDAPPRPAPSRARTVLLGEGGPGAATQPIVPPDSETTPSYELPGAPGPGRVAALACLAAAVTLGALLATGGDGPEAVASARATAAAAALRTSMLAAAPEAGVAAATAAGAIVLGTGTARAEDRLRTACASDSALPRHWVASPAALARWGATPCTEPRDTPPVAPPTLELPSGDATTWTADGTVYARVSVTAEPACSGCHGPEARSGTLGTVVAGVPARGRSHLVVWPLISGLAVGAAGLLALRRRVVAFRSADGD